MGRGSPKRPTSGCDFAPACAAALLLNGDLRWNTAGCFQRDAGTIAFWLRPTWPGNDKLTRTLFSLYGNRELRQPWLFNRYSITAGRGQLTFWIAGAREGQRLTLRSPIAAWQPGAWRHVAVCWSGVNSGRPDACASLYLDGVRVDRASGLRLDVGPVAGTFDIGRDSDRSPQHADADYDEFYIYGRAFPGPNCAARSSGPAAAMRRPRSRCPPGGPAATGGTTPGRSAPRHGRTPRIDRRPHRVSVAVGLAVRRSGTRRFSGPSIPRVCGSCLATRRAAAAGPAAQPLAAVIEPDAAAWQMPGMAKPREPMAFELYFDVAELDLAAPLWVRVRRRGWAKPDAARFVAPDYARDVYGKAWDFNRDGDFEGIDGWGNRPEFIRNRLVKNGGDELRRQRRPLFHLGRHVVEPSQNEPPGGDRSG